MKEYRHYVENDNLQNATHVEVSVTYSKGGVSYFTGNTSPRGFYLNATPVTRGKGMVSFTMFSGIRRLLLEVNRYSDKQFNHAVELSKAFEADMVASVIEKNKAA